MKTTVVDFDYAASAELYPGKRSKRFRTMAIAALIQPRRHFDMSSKKCRLNFWPVPSSKPRNSVSEPTGLPSFTKTTPIPCREPDSNKG